MEKISIAEIISATNGNLLSGNTDGTINSVCIDTRKIEKNSLFIPLVGEKVDGHDFINDAFELGASVSLIQKDHRPCEIAGALIEVKSTQKALGDLAKYYRNKFSLPVIGVTGSVGKTTTKEMIAAALGESLKVLKTEGNYNGQIGLPLTIFNINRTYDVAIFEMGVSEFGEMDRLADIANIDIGVVTNIGLTHIEYFKSIENTCNEKLKMMKKLDGIFYLNGDSPLLADAKNKITQEIIYFGINGNYPFKCEDIYSNDRETNFTLVTPEFREPITIPCLGIHNVYNALAAIAVATGMGLHLDDIKKGLLKFKNVNMRQQISDLGGITLIDDSYNASPDSVKSSVSILKNLSPEGKNIVVIADMLELGEHSHEIHFDTGRYIALEGIDVLITIGENAKFLSDGAKSANQNIVTMHCKSNTEAFEELKKIIFENDKILIKGSRGMHTDEIIKYLKAEFN